MTLRQLLDNLKRLFVKRRAAADTVVTDLMCDEQTLARYADNFTFWHIAANAEASNDEKRIFYRNLVRLTFVHKVDSDKVKIVVSGRVESARVTADELRQRGFRHVRVEADATGRLPHVNNSGEFEDTYSKGEGCVFTEFYVAGVQYAVADDDPLWRDLTTDSKIRLVAQPDNAHDRNAVRVILEGKPQRLLGYVPRDRNTGLSALLLSGNSDVLEARITELNFDAPTFSRIFVTIYTVRQ